MSRILTVAVLVSGEGTTLDALAEEASGGHLPIRIALVVADRPHAPAIEKARQRGLATLVLPSRGTPADDWGRRVTDELTARGVELVVNAGFLTILPPSWVRAWRGRAINLHPSLLPLHGGRGLYGLRVHEAVLAARERVTGATVHLVTDDVDRGPTIAQERIEVLPDDTPASLRARLHPVEVALLGATLRRFADGSLPLPYPEPGAEPAPRS
ncbi:MAG TPA: phosphoribosylglycinamide formyltransferase [Thermoplasmata archaeon]|nr:phosphoribosylglycinamide formyltransferase [Thermoplasmata archaeon]